MLSNINLKNLPSYGICFERGIEKGIIIAFEYGAKKEELAKKYN